MSLPTYDELEQREDYPECLQPYIQALAAQQSTGDDSQEDDLDMACRAWSIVQLCGRGVDFDTAVELMNKDGSFDIKVEGGAFELTFRPDRDEDDDV